MIDWFFISACTLSLLLSFLLFTKREDHTSIYILASWLLLSAIEIVLCYVYVIAEIKSSANMVFVLQAFPLLHVGMLYNFTRSVRGELSVKKFAIPFLPFILMASNALVMILLLSEGQKAEVYDQVKQYSYSHQIFPDAISGAFFLIHNALVGVLMYLSFKNAFGMFSEVRDKPDSPQKRNTLWIFGVVGGYTVAWFSIQAILLINNFVGMVTINEVQIFSLFVSSLFIILLGFTGIRQTSLFLDSSMVASRISSKKHAYFLSGTDDRYERSGLSAHETEHIIRQLKETMESKKLYLKTDLTLQSLADELSISSNHVSRAINEQEGVNFFDFVNKYRVREFKERALNPSNQHLNIIALAFESGFKSKTTFYDIFKRETGLTPTQFIKQTQPG